MNENVNDAVQAASRQNPSGRSGAGKNGRGRYLNQEKTQARRRRKKKSSVKYAVLAVLLIAAVLLVLLRGCVGGDILKGQWSIDTVTSYSFDGRGNGSLILPEKEYAFRYELEGDSLSIDFENEAARDFQYTCILEGDTLTLTGGEGDDDVVYVLTRQ